jgi:hypothetical protein
VAKTTLDGEKQLLEEVGSDFLEEVENRMTALEARVEVLERRVMPLGVKDDTSREEQAATQDGNSDLSRDDAGEAGGVHRGE